MRYIAIERNSGTIVANRSTLARAIYTCKNIGYSPDQIRMYIIDSTYTTAVPAADYSETPKPAMLWKNVSV